MQAISLKKVTIVVISLIIVSHFASANGNDLSNELQTVGTGISNITNSNSTKFNQLIKEFDLDKNDLLSRDEIKLIKRERLLKQFSTIDLNSDSSISKDEFNQFMTQAK